DGDLRVGGGSDLAGLICEAHRDRFGAGAQARSGDGHRLARFDPRREDAADDGRHRTEPAVDEVGEAGHDERPQGDEDRAGKGGASVDAAGAAAALRSRGSRTSSFTLAREPGGPRLTRSPSCRTCPAPTRSPFTYVPAALPTSVRSMPREASHRTRAWMASTLSASRRRWASGLAPRTLSTPGLSRVISVPSHGGPVTISVGCVASLKES